MTPLCILLGLGDSLKALYSAHTPLVAQWSHKATSVYLSVRPWLCTLAPLSFFGHVASHPAFPSPGLRLATCKRGRSQPHLRRSGDARVTRTGVSGQHEDGFTASCVLVCSRAFGFSVSVLFFPVLCRQILLFSLQRKRFRTDN